MTRSSQTTHELFSLQKQEYREYQKKASGSRAVRNEQASPLNYLNATRGKGGGGDIAGAKEAKRSKTQETN